MEDVTVNCGGTEAWAPVLFANVAMGTIMFACLVAGY